MGLRVLQPIPIPQPAQCYALPKHALADCLSVTISVGDPELWQSVREVSVARPIILGQLPAHSHEIHCSARLPRSACVLVVGLWCIITAWGAAWVICTPHAMMVRSWSSTPSVGAFQGEIWASRLTKVMAVVFPCNSLCCPSDECNIPCSLPGSLRAL